MTSGRYGLVLREVGRLLGGGSASGLGSGPLLERFASGGDPAAFEALVSRHGPMVLGTCRRMLSDPLDVEDAFQATFLVLARKAGSIGDADRLGPWLHGVARRVAARSRALSSRRKAFERPGGDDLAFEADCPVEGGELREVLDEELARLPEKYRAPLVLCYLEGLTHDEAAEHLRWPVGTVRSRLAGGRDRLRIRLARRGLAPSASVPLVLSPASIPQALLSTTIRVATAAGPTSARVVVLAKGALIAMTWNNLKLAAAVGLMAGLTAGGAGVAAQYGVASRQEGEAPAKAPAPKKPTGDLSEKAARLIHRAGSPEELAAERRRFVDQLAEIQGRIEKSREEIADNEALAREIRAILEQLERRGAEPATVAGTPAANEGRAPAAGEKGVGDRPKPAATPGGPAQVQGMGSMMGGGGVGGGMMGMGGGGMGAGMMGMGGKRSPMVVQFGGSQILAIPAEYDRATVVNTETGVKSTQRFPEGLTEVMPVIGPGVVGFVLKGPEVRQIAAFDIQGGKWYAQELKVPVREANPIVGPNQVTYQLGRFLCIFSIPAKKWSVLELKRDPGPGNFYQGMFGGHDGKMVIPEGDLVHIYDPKTGEWTHVDTKDDQ